jgi:hypothetical protein
LDNKNLIKLSKRNVLGNSSINIRDDNFVVVAPEINVAFASSRALVSSCNAEYGLIRPFSQI